ncbi:MAG TPA: precorrin-4 C(11)-methyltransferase, partial [Pseudonocardiaceae bacterium]
AMTSGRVSFVGAGPGAADLITLRGAKRIAEADIVVWAASLVDPECVRQSARPDAELIDSSLITHEDVLAVYRRAASERLKVARVHSGDPSLWGAVQEQYDSCQRLGLEVEIVPGVSAFSAAAAIVGRELTVPEVAQSVILTRLEGGKTPMPDSERLREFARHGTTMAIFLSAARSGQLVDELRAGGYPDDTPVVVAYKATWPDELILHTTLGELTETVKQHKLWRHTLFLVGKALRASGTRSHLYNAGHFHTYRKADPAARQQLRGEQADTGAKTGSPLQTSRSGWVAARVENRNWSGTSGQSGQESVAAWSAVHGWQETARSATRSGYRTKLTADGPRPVRPVPADQETLALESTPAPEPPKVEPPKPKLAAVPAPQPTRQTRQGGKKTGQKRSGGGRPNAKGG